MTKVQSTVAPARVMLERPEGRIIVRLAENIRRVTAEDGVIYEWDEVEFDLPPDRMGETAESIEANFDAWWEYGSQAQETPTLEQRVSDLEDALMAMLEV